MNVATAAGWALVGAVVAEAFLHLGRIRAGNAGARLPWRTGADLAADGLAFLLRALAGCGLAAAGVAAGQICDVGPAFVAGLAAPLLVAKIFQVVEPMTRSTEELKAEPASPFGVQRTRSGSEKASDASH
ncbi:hypothetical protein [Hamadaea tsunoensis]|uniref:hypothetical protein n=1 Tax=Hamadaea tsunoensis TaxID=53368 RepID=UPI0012FB0B83|nr:hypothetical protein [Hamadaea tsunoensis]